MAFAYPMQKLQDWLTQQWVILWGRRIDPAKYSWLLGPFGNLDSIGDDFINQFAAKEGLTIQREGETRGLVPAMNSLIQSEAELAKVSARVIDFYENTSTYDLHFTVKWNPFFRVFGFLITKLFSRRLNQLNIPSQSSKTFELLESELITLVDPESKEPKYTFWKRSIKSTGQSIYTGVYGTGILPSGATCIKAVFPLPNGNATVLMTPSVGENGEFVLDSSGKRFGDAGFYFLLKDSKGKYWSQYIKSFRDRLTVREEKDGLSAEQVLTLWHKEVLRFNYKIGRNS